jgi:hypothetical protein
MIDDHGAPGSSSGSLKRQRGIAGALDREHTGIDRQRKGAEPGK